MKVILTRTCGYPLIAIFLAISLFCVRPVQDDYATLVGLSEGGVFGYLQKMWLTHGGNLTSILVNSLAVSVSAPKFPFLGLTAYSVIMFMFIYWISYLYAREFITVSGSRKTIYFFLVLIFSLEGIVSPGFISSFFFSSASATHLLPVLLTLILILVSTNNIKATRSFLLVLLGFLASNSNIAEGLAALALFVLLLTHSIRSKHYVKIRNLSCSILGLLSGNLATALAPGFKVRAEIASGDNLSAFQKIQKILESFLIHIADLLLHPGWILGIILGTTLSYSVSRNKLIQLKFITCAVGCYFILLFLALTIGSGLAYSAWHQTLGLNLLFSFSAFLLATIFSPFSKQISWLAPRILPSLLVLSLLFLGRGVFGLVNRSIVWDNNLNSNLCIVLQGNLENLKGVEIVYPPFGFGFTDIDTWDWMKNDYSRWLVQQDRITLKGCVEK